VNIREKKIEKRRILNQKTVFSLKSLGLFIKVALLDSVARMAAE
jgi:hypothetical protein